LISSSVIASNLAASSRRSHSSASSSLGFVLLLKYGTATDAKISHAVAACFG
jgi:hypothetical protein